MSESPTTSEAESSLNANTLLGLFYDPPSKACLVKQISHDSVPAPYDRLLVHENHMTVTVESFHDSLVDVRVLDEKKTDAIYARKILLTRQSDGAVVQFGVVRLHRNLLPAAARDAIEAKQVPLGRILIEQGLLRHVQLLDLWQCDTNGELQQLLELEQPKTVYGRTAIIHVDGQPVIELLEIVTAAG